MNIYKSLIACALLSTTLFADGDLVAKPPMFPRPPVLPITPVIKTVHLHASELASELDGVLSRAKMKLNNYKTQSSFVELRGVNFPFQIARTVVDIDCGTFCPDLGDGYFYLNDVNLARGYVRAGSGNLEMTLEFEDSGREIKGIHSLFGDDGMPDFQMDRLSLKLVAQPAVVNGQVTLLIATSDLRADIQSTGGCHIGGIDICNKIFGTNRKIEKSVEAAAKNAFNGGLIQTALRLAVSGWLHSKGVTGAVRSVSLVGNDLAVTLQ